MNRDDLIYKPPESSEEPEYPTFGVKFSKDIFLLTSFLDAQGIEYKEEDLDWSPLGMGIRIRK